MVEVLELVQELEAESGDDATSVELQLRIG
jgi:hypothetical protein